MTSDRSWQAYIDSLQSRLVCIFDIFHEYRVVGFLVGRHLKINIQMRLPYRSPRVPVRVNHKREHHVYTDLQ